MTTKISICMGSSCFARGNAINLKTIEEYIAKNNLEAEIDVITSYSIHYTKLYEYLINGLSAPILIDNSSAEPIIPDNILLKSWAIPPAS